MASLAFMVLISFFFMCIFGLILSLESSSTTDLTTTNQPNTLPKVCGICDCKDDKIDCSNRKLNNTLNDYEWPKKLIKVITFENNHIMHIKPFPNVTVNKLIFSHNKIEKIDNAAFKMLSNLTELDLSHNLLTRENFIPCALEGPYLPGIYEPLEKLRLLNLSGNKFYSLHHDLFEHVSSLKTLILSNNPFLEFDNSAVLAVSAIPYLEELDLSYCKLKKIEKMALHSLRSLKKLDLSWNEFSNLPDALQECKSLQTLTLDGNSIKFLGHNNTFPLLPNLKKLSICNMPKLFVIDKGALANLEALEILSIENCTLLSEINVDALAKQMEKGGATWPRMKSLNLSNNALHYLPATLIPRWDTLKELHLMNNNWNCDCDNQYLIGTLLPDHGKRLMGNESTALRCSAPPEHLNKSLASLSSRKLRCLDMYGARPERDAAILVGCFAGVLMAVPLILLFLFFWRRGFLFCGPQGPASFSRAFYKRTSPYDDDDT